MLRRVLAAQGVAVLMLTMPPEILAQLPDAPSAVRAAQQAEQLRAAEPDDEDAAFRNALWREWTAAPAPPMLGAGNETAETGYSSSAINSLQIGPGATDLHAINSPQMVLLTEVASAEQQSFSSSPRGRSRPTFASSRAYMGAVPGSAPALHDTCPRNSCPAIPVDMCCGPISSPFEQYLKWPDVVPLTARDNLRSAARGVIDPFNLLTIAADAAIGIASDPNSPYGPGMRGFSKYAGVSLTEDMTGEFFGTFLVPSLVHQDPHYHREPFMPVRHRILHAITQIVWTQSYTGKPMFNYANFVGGAATAAVSNTFVPGPNRQGFGNTAERLALAFAISPSGNLIEEFVPDLATHVNLRVVIFQRILNSVTLEESGMQ
jgi:hypothetical protein